MDVAYEADPNYHSGFKHCGTMCYQAGRFAEEDWSNNIERNPSSSARECRDRCRQVAACEYWIFHVKDWMCRLKWRVEPGNIVYKMDAVSGLKSCPANMGTWGDNFLFCTKRECC